MLFCFITVVEFFEGVEFSGARLQVFDGLQLALSLEVAVEFFHAHRHQPGIYLVCAACQGLGHFIGPQAFGLQSVYDQVYGFDVFFDFSHRHLVPEFEVLFYFVELGLAAFVAEF